MQDLVAFWFMSQINIMKDHLILNILNPTTNESISVYLNKQTQSIFCNCLNVFSSIACVMSRLRSMNDSNSKVNILPSTWHYPAPTCRRSLCTGRDRTGRPRGWRESHHPPDSPPTPPSQPSGPPVCNARINKTL